MLASAAPFRRMAAGVSASISSRHPHKEGGEHTPLFPGTSDNSPTGMGTLKHRAAGSVGDGLVAYAYDEGRGGGVLGGTPSAASALSSTVLLCVAVASCGAFSFGYHLGVVNGPLGVLAEQLGFGGNATLQGLVGGGLPAAPAGKPSATRCMPALPRITLQAKGIVVHL